MQKIFKWRIIDYMPALTITLPSKYSEKAKEQARSEGFQDLSLWLQFLVKSRVSLEESPKIKPASVISEMQKTGLYNERFLRDLKKSLEYADKTAQ